MRVLKFRRGADCQRLAATLDKDFQLLVKLNREHRIEELREDCLVIQVARDDILQAIEFDELYDEILNEGVAND